MPKVSVLPLGLSTRDSGRHNRGKSERNGLTFNGGKIIFGIVGKIFTAKGGEADRNIIFWGGEADQT